MDAFMKEFEHLKIQLEDIKTATNNFDFQQVIGIGGFGIVYQGQLLSHSTVAFKRLDRKHGQGDPEFWKEIMMLSRYSHENLITLLGYCDEDGEKILVYEHASNGSLDTHLGTTDLTWTQRIKICVDVAKGLRYLHDDKGTQQRVLHRDIKSSNILLDDNWNAKLSDMGLSKLGPANQTHTVLVTNIVGTPGYCDPLYMEKYLLTKESDIYSFGVVLFEVLCGRLCFEYVNNEFRILVPKWKQSYEEKKLNEIIFQHMKEQMDSSSLESFSDIAYQCLQRSREERPTIDLVVEKLETALEFQERHDVKLPKEYEEIVKAAETPLKYRSQVELNMLLSKGVFLNNDKTWFSVNDNGEHYVMISIADCLISDANKVYGVQHWSGNNSRFSSGRFITYGWGFKTRVKTQFLSPRITYNVNLIFKCLHKEYSEKQQYTALRYELQGETKIVIMYLADEKEDVWSMARLYQLTIDQSYVDLEINFRHHRFCKGLQVEGIEFQPVEHLEHLIEYREILKSAVTPLIYRSVEELKELLSKGVLLNEGKTWFSLNKKGEHCEMISIVECLVPFASPEPLYFEYYNSRFLRGAYELDRDKVKIHVRSQFLSPLITYAVNLVFKFKHWMKKTRHLDISLEYKLEGETQTWISQHAYEKEDGWLMAELYHFTSDGSIVDFEIILQDLGYMLAVEGIEFQPLEEVENVQSISDDDMYKEEKLPNDYLDILKMSKDCVEWKTKEKLYYILRSGILIKNDNDSLEWFFIDKNGKKCQMLPARVVCVTSNYSFQSATQSRFGDALVQKDWKFSIAIEMKSLELSSETTYACYLVYKLSEDYSLDKACVRIEDKDFGLRYTTTNFRYIHLVTPPTPFINIDQNSYNTLNKPKIKGHPQQRRDCWMEVQLCEVDIYTRLIPVRLELATTNDNSLVGLIIQGIEFRPI